MKAIKFELLGKEALMRKLDSNNFKRPISESIRKLTLWFEANVIVSTPVITTRLRSSVTSKIEPQGGAVFTNVEYAPFVEYGTKRMEARHVERGSSARRLGIGPFTYVMEKLLPDKMRNFSGEIVKKLKARFE